MRFARNEFALDKVQSDGVTMREHLQSIARQSGKTPQELEPVPCPDSMMPLWQMFLQLHSARSMSIDGPQPISYSEIAAWNALTGQQVTPDEVAAIRAIDRAFLTCALQK